MLQVAAVLAALATAQKFLDFPLVKRLISNAAAKSTNRLDDWVVSILYGTPEALVPAALEQAQTAIDATPGLKEQLRAEPSTIPAMPSDLPGDMTVPEP